MHEIDLPRGRDLSPRRGKRRRHTPGALATLLVAALAAACTDNGVEPTPAVTPAPAAPARAFVSPVADAPMSAASLYVPASNAVRWGEVPWTELPADFGDAGWVELRTTGQVSWTINTATYAVNSWYCHGSNAYPYYGEGSAGGAGNASSNLRMTAVVSSAAPADDDYGALMVNRGAGQVYRLSAAWPGARLYAKRSGLPGVCNGAPWYNFTGEHTVEVVKVVPVQVAPNKPEFLPGEVLTWTTVLYHGVTATDLKWTFERTSGEVDYPSCWASTCEYAPRGPGRMKVAGKWELAAPTVHVHGYSALVTVQPPKLVLSCPASVQRGNVMACGAVAQGGALQNPVWTFTDSAGTHTFTAPAGTGNTWGGPMVVSGTLIASGFIGNVPVADTALITVTRRAWSPFQQSVRTLWNDTLLAKSPKYPPLVTSSLANTDIEVPGALPVDSVATGPNTGWVYFSAQPGAVDVVVRMNPAWSPSDPWYQKQNGAGTSPAGAPYCAQSDMPLILDRTSVHEGRIAAPAPGDTWVTSASHVSVLSSFFSGNSVTQTALEEWVLHKSNLVGSAQDEARLAYWNLVASPALQDPKQGHLGVDPGGLVERAPFPCQLKF